MVSNGAAIATPIVAGIALVIWIGLCFWADSHPVHKRADKLPYEVSGGAFEARDGGRQLMPMPERPPMPTEEEIAAGAAIPPDVPAPRPAPGVARAGASATAGREDQERDLTPGSKLRLAVSERSRLPRAAGTATAACVRWSAARCC